MLYDSFLVAAGGCLGAVCRFAISNWSKKHIRSKLPYGTLIVNLTGSFLLGFIIGSCLNNTLYLLLGTGFMGAFTTFSTFKLESLQLGAQNNLSTLSVYLGVSYTLGIALAYAGYLLGAAAFSPIL